MQKRAILLRNGSTLQPATEYDAELLRDCGTSFAVEIKTSRSRSLQHHRLFFGGLLRLAFDYWEPQGGLISPAEINILEKFVEFLADFADKSSLDAARDAFLTSLSDNRASKIETPYKSFQALFEWVKVEAGYFDYIYTPSGVKKQPRSISFSKMNQADFNEFYRQAFSVVWRFVLSRQFQTEEEAQQAVDLMVGMG